MRFLSYISIWSILLAIVAANTVHYLEAGDSYSYVSTRKHRSFVERELNTYCYRGNPRSFQRLFETVEFRLDIDGTDYTQYAGKSPSEVLQHYEEQRYIFSFNLFTQKRPRLPLSPFMETCMGIETIQSYTIRVRRLRVDFWRFIQLIIGCLVFHYSGKLTQKAIFYYLAGIILGICSSFMLLIWLTSKLLPGRKMMYGFLIGGWSIGLYVVQMLWDNVQLIVITYKTYVFWYILATGAISFLFCYRYGPPRNQRSKNVIKWLLQFLSLVTIYYSSYYEEATTAICILMFAFYYLPRSPFYKIRAFYLRKFPAKRRLLTIEEYDSEGIRETCVALQKLRDYASSPDCPQWKMMKRLRDPLRFASFVEGDSHINDEEILHYESSRFSEDIDGEDSDLSGNYSNCDQVDGEISEDEEFNSNMILPRASVYSTNLPNPSAIVNPNTTLLSPKNRLLVGGE